MVNGIRRTYSISFPRSGHGWLVDMLRMNYGTRLNYSESYVTNETRHELCETTNLTKEHDLELELPVRRDCQYLVQLRNPVDAVLSWIEQRAKNRGGLTGQERRELFDRWMRFYVEWLKKWVLADLRAPRLIVTYESLRTWPIENLRRITRFLSDEDPILKVHHAQAPTILHVERTVDELEEHF